MYDFHIHSNFSPDGFMQMEEAVESAIQKGLKEICFTDHMDYDYDGNGNDYKFDYREYFLSIQACQDKYAGKIIINKGIEMGVQPHILDRCKEDVEKYDFDFVIASIHSVEKSELFLNNFFDGKTQEKAYEIYFNELEDVVNNYDGYSVLGHLDIIKRYGGFDLPLQLEAYEVFTTAILKKLIEKGKGIEVNTSGIRYNLGNYHPSIDIIELYHRLGGEIITLGSDAHYPHHVAFDFHDALNQLKTIGFQYITTFKEMKPRFHSIDKLLI
ncbi:histidinol-phosphatase HisK [Clostridium aceticum]|uniref:Histidinol-phosphatase n=1 Tax=Clostridium aceticum TaxID=84022 RepID=A0A0G3WAI9_9CLOT|nr:histidinol-phosphatase HisJ family protein [Clostridium aceticum]AKL94895.1 histidinol-phosphatase HisK [Clostridium aceticum]